MAEKVRILTFAEIEETDTPPPDTEGFQGTRHLLNGATTETPDIYADHVRLAPGFIHHLHRHPHSEQFVLPTAGELLIADQHGSHRVELGQLIVIPRNTFHSLRNVSDEDATALLFFPGIGGIGEAGYELHEDPQLIDRRLAVDRL